MRIWLLNTEDRVTPERTSHYIEALVEKNIDESRSEGLKENEEERYSTVKMEDGVVAAHSPGTDTLMAAAGSVTEMEGCTSTPPHCPPATSRSVTALPPPAATTPPPPATTVPDFTSWRGEAINYKL